METTAAQAFSRAVEAILEHRSRTGDATREASIEAAIAIFYALREACLHAAKTPEALACSELSLEKRQWYASQPGGFEVEVLTFLHEFLHANNLRKRQVIEVVQNLMTAPNWSQAVELCPELLARMEAVKSLAPPNPDKNAEQSNAGAAAPAPVDTKQGQPEDPSKIVAAQWMYADHGARTSLTWNNPVRWSGKMPVDELAVKVLEANHKARPFYVYLYFAGGREEWVKCRTAADEDGAADDILRLIEEKRVFVAENRTGIECEEGRSCDVPKGAQVCRAWYGKVGYRSGPRGCDVTEKVLELLRASSTVSASNQNFGDAQPGKNKVLYVEFRAP